MDYAVTSGMGVETVGIGAALIDDTVIELIAVVVACFGIGVCLEIGHGDECEVVDAVAAMGSMEGAFVVLSSVGIRSSSNGDTVAVVGLVGAEGVGDGEEVGGMYREEKECLDDAVRGEGLSDDVGAGLCKGGAREMEGVALADGGCDGVVVDAR